MKIEKQQTGKELHVKIIGRLDTMTSPQLEKELSECLGGVEKLVFDFVDLQYVSSAGLRVLLSTQKRMKSQRGDMVIQNVNDDVMEVFEITGFVDILTIE